MSVRMHHLDRKTPSRRIPRRDSAIAYTAGHGVIEQPELLTIDSSLLVQLALGRAAIGGPAVGTLAQLPQRVTTRPRPHVNGSHESIGLQDPPAVYDPSPESPERDALETYIEHRLKDATVLRLPNRHLSYRFFKRLIDVVGAVVLLFLSAPLICLLILLIRVDSRGPAIFRQTRITRGGRSFTFYKLEDDPRNTRVGRWLRRTTLDELPNLFNVLFGNLSLVGPRPDLPELVRYYSPEELACLFTKAGVTGLAQVAGRSLLTVRERLTLDMRYVSHQTLGLDIRILLKTIGVVVTGRGAF